mgnify:CR=1 FL=1
MNKTLDSKYSYRWDNHIYLYSTHDTLLGYLLSAIGSNIGQPSGLAFELITDDQNWPSIRMYYLNGTDNFFINLLGNALDSNRYRCKCNRNCSYDNFIQMLIELIPENIVQEYSIDPKMRNNNCTCS